MRSVILGLSGLLLIAFNATAATTYQYDDLGRLSTVAYGNGKQITYTYDPAGNRAQVVTANAPPHSEAVRAAGHKHKKSARKKTLH